MDDPDIIYVVRRNARNESLRLSLRSLENLPHRRVFIAGYCPPWVKNVTPVPVTRKVNKFVSIETNLRHALLHPELGEQAVYFNDDFYVMEPIPFVPVMHGGLAADYKQSGELMWRMRATRKLLHDQALTYDGIHVPLPIMTAPAQSTLRTIPSGLLWRTWFGNVWDLGGEQVADVKARDGKPIPGPFMSSSERTFNTLKRHLDDALPRRSPYV